MKEPASALGTHKAIQTNYSKTFNLLASANFTGPYDYQQFVDFVFNQPNRGTLYLAIYNWATFAMNEFYLSDRPFDQIWKYPVKDPMDAILVPSEKPVDIYQPFFLNMIQQRTDAGVQTAISANSLNTGWVPEKPVFFYVGVTDQIIPHQITIDTYNEFKQEGAEVTLYKYPGDHFTAVYDYFFQMIENVDSLNQLNQ